MKVFSRRFYIDLNVPAELAVRNAMLEVEKMPADERLTNVLIQLDKAKSLLSDVVDEHIKQTLKF